MDERRKEGKRIGTAWVRQEFLQRPEKQVEYWLDVAWKLYLHKNGWVRAGDDLLMCNLRHDANEKMAIPNVKVT